MKEMKQTIIIPERLERFLSEDFHLRSGTGEGVNGKADVCIMQSVDWLTGGDGKTDAPECASPALTRYLIRLNDSWLFSEHRDSLKQYAIKVVGTRDGRDEERAFIAANYAVRVFLPIWLRADRQQRYEADALALEALSPVTDKNTAKAGSDLTLGIRKKLADTAYAYAAGAAAAYAADAAYAAYAAADADAAADAYDADAAADAAVATADAAVAADADDAAADAAYAADADAAAVYDAAAAVYDDAAGITNTLRAKSLECLDAMILV